METEDACFFDRLPSAMRDSFLQQAFKLLDQHHQLQVVPLVCRLWQQLVPSTCTSLKIKVMDCGAAVDIKSWLRKVKPPLESIELEIGDSEWMEVEVRELLEVVCEKVSLRSLKVDDLIAVDSDISLSSLTNLTSLDLHGFNLGIQTRDSVLLLTQLRHLKLIDMGIKQEALLSLLQGLASSTLHLTTLDILSGTTLTNPQQLLPLTSLRSLKHLGLNYIAVEAEGMTALNHLPITSIRVIIKDGQVRDVCSWLQGGGVKLDTLNLTGDIFEPLPLLDVELLMSHLRTCVPQLQSLSVLCMTQLNHSTGLAGLTQLTKLLVHMSDVDDVALLRLCALTGLRELDISNNRVAGAGGSFLSLASSLQQLTRLDTQAHLVAKQAFGSRVVEASGWRLTLRPGVPADG
jgi:hypothetical protein